MSESDASVLRVVLDANVIVSGVILSRGVPYEILQAWRRQSFVLVTSEAILAELIEVLHRPKLRDDYSVSENASERLITLLRETALVVPGALEVSRLTTDPDDDKFLACALEAQADCIVTGDKHLLSLGQYQRIVILRPAEFLARLGLAP